MLKGLPCDKNTIGSKSFSFVRFKPLNHYLLCRHVFVINIQRPFGFVLKTHYFCVDYSLDREAVLLKVFFVFQPF